MLLRNSFRVIVVGGGTGGVTVFYGEQLNHTNAEVVYVDFSTTSMKISQQRARFRKLINIIWIRTWIEEVRHLGIGLFEQSQCSGVLHHLKTPILGLNILKGLLTVHGGINLMVYAEIGRKAVYQIQHILKIMKSTSGIGMFKELKLANHTLNVLPSNHWFHMRSNIRDHHKYGNIGIYDLLLHKRDVSFSISSLLQWIGAGGLHLVDFNSFKTRYRFNIKYYNLGVLFEHKISLLPKLQQWSISELLLGGVIKHELFVSKYESSEAKLIDQSNQFFLCGNPIGLKEAFFNLKNRMVMRNKDIFLGTLASIYLPDHSEILTSGGNDSNVIFAIETNPFIVFLMSKILQHPRGVGLKFAYSQYRKVSNLTNLSYQKMHALAKLFYESIKDAGLILLRDISVPPFPKTSSVALYYVT